MNENQGCNQKKMKTQAMQSSSRPFFWVVTQRLSPTKEKRCVTTLITVAKETRGNVHEKIIPEANSHG